MRAGTGLVAMISIGLMACGGGGGSGGDDDDAIDAAGGGDASDPADATPVDAVPLLALGEACGEAGACASGFCASGVCCDGACDDACATCGPAGTCGPVAAAVECRGVAGACDLAEACDGVSTACPADAVRDDENICRGAAGACDVYESCDGVNPECPADLLRPIGAACGAFECTGVAACPSQCSTHAECTDGAMCVGSVCTFGKWAFTTSTTINGNLGGLTGGDAFCQARAVAAGLPGTYMAWLGTAAGSPSTRFSRPTVPYFLPAGGVNVIKLADSWTDLVDGTLDANFDRTELGVAVPSNIPWTNAQYDGVTLNGANNCLAWTTSSSSYQGNSGLSSTTNVTWAQSSITHCGVLHRLFCFEQ